MACEVCQHCQTPVSRDDGYKTREGFSYHKNCHKCYVCNETNLQNAEVFKGVIFCSSCSQRIFQGCSTARRTRSGSRDKSKTRSKRRERSRVKGRRAERAITRPTTGVIQLARLTASTDSDSKSNSRETDKEQWKPSKTPVVTTETLQVGQQVHDTNWRNLKKYSTEIGVTTDVTQELLKQMNCPVVEDFEQIVKSPPPKVQSKYKGDCKRVSERNKKACSDLRMAELGASTEIAHMTLRKKSEVPVVINSESRIKDMESQNLSVLNQESDVSGKGNEDWVDSSFSSKQPEKLHWLDRRLGSILKMPYKCFKKNIWNRSSLISILMTSQEEDYVLVNRLKMLFREEIMEHQSRGMKRLYSTINRRKKPYKLGWLDLMAKVSIHRCKHFRRSHSYRCMRSQVLRLAGPTKSE
ncbi:uncharacterized protein ACR2FA_010745 [Aphomia sociella]